MAQVNVSWEVEAQAIAGAESYSAFDVRVGDAGILLPLDARSTSFFGVAPGTYAVSVQLIRGDGTSDVSKLEDSVVVPEVATAPVPVRLSASVS